MNGEKLPKCLRFVLPAAACNFNSYEAKSGLFFKTRLGSSVEKDIFGRGAWGAGSVPPQRLRSACGRNISG